MKKMFTYLLDLLYPPRCGCCEAGVSSHEILCCPKCGPTLSWYAPDEALFAGEHFSRCISAGRYEGGLRFALLQFKFGGQRQLARLFAPRLALQVRLHADQAFDFLTWVPISPRRLRKRGYDQARLLCEALAGELCQPCRPLLRHPRYKPAQSGMHSREARARNVQGCFEAATGAELAGLRILLVDDVLTTGATLEEAAKTLRAAGAAEVLCATACRVEAAALALRIRE